MIDKNPEDQVFTNEYNYKPIDVMSLWRILLRNKLIIFSSTTLFSILAIIYALNVTPIYRAELLMVAAQDSGNTSSLANQFGGLASTFGVSLGSDNLLGDTEKALAILTSRTFTAKYIQEENLMPAIFPDNWDEENKKWINGEEPSSQAAFGVASSRLFLQRDRTTGLMTLGIEATDPQFAADWANSLISRLNEHMRLQAIEETEENIFFLEKQVAKTNLLNAQNVLYNLIQEETKNIMLANVREEYAFKVIDPAVAPEERIRPKRRQIAMAGFILGFLIGLVGIFGREFYTNVIKS